MVATIPVNGFASSLDLSSKTVVLPDNYTGGLIVPLQRTTWTSNTPYVDFTVDTTKFNLFRLTWEISHNNEAKNDTNAWSHTAFRFSLSGGPIDSAGAYNNTLMYIEANATSTSRNAQNYRHDQRAGWLAGNGRDFGSQGTGIISIPQLDEGHAGIRGMSTLKSEDGSAGNLTYYEEEFSSTLVNDMAGTGTITGFRVFGVQSWSENGDLGSNDDNSRSGQIFLEGFEKS